MDHRSAAWLAWPLWALIVAGIFLGFLLWPVSEVALIPLVVSAALPFATVGALVASRRPHNPVGWLSSLSLRPLPSGSPEANMRRIPYSNTQARSPPEI
jgi:hypothetical protein